MSESQTAVVLQGTGGIWHVRTQDGGEEDLKVSMRGRIKRESEDYLKLAVGDRVRLERDAPDSAWAIAEVLPRKSQLARRAPGSGYGERIVAANVDQVMVVFAMVKPEPNLAMLDRFLVIAEANDLSARIVINKVDLAGEAGARRLVSDYAKAGYPLHFTSVKQNMGLAELRSALENRTTVLSGPSGVGKSSLLNTLFPGLNLRVGEISESVNKGRHTTVGALLHHLSGDSYVVDTPGLREVGMWGLDPDSLDECFPEFAPLLSLCRFTDCTHTAEPGCKIRDAVAKREISEARYESYRKLREELTETEKVSMQPRKPPKARRRS